MTDTLTLVHEPIRRYVFTPCREDRHDLCPTWQPGYVDGQLRSAGEQCACTCGHKKDPSIMEPAKD